VSGPRRLTEGRGEGRGAGPGTFLRVLLVVVAALVAAGAPLFAEGAQGAAGRSELEPMPLPVAGAVEEAVSRELSAAREQVEVLSADVSTSPEELTSAYGELGRLFAAYGLWGPARAAFDNAGKLAPGAAARRDWVYLAGYVLERQGQLDQAIEHYRDAVALSPGATAPKMRLALALVELGQAGEAQALLDDLAGRRPAAAAAHFGLGRLAARRGDTRAAAEHFERTLELQPGAAQVHYPLAQAYRRLGDLARARAQLELHAAAGEEPGRVTFPDPLVEALASAGSGGALHKFRGDQLLLAGDTAGAAAAYRRAVEADPTSYWARKSLALTLHELGRVDEAERELTAALELDPSESGLPASGVARERARLVYALGGIAANRGHLEEALERFGHAAKLDPAYAEPHVQLGNLLGRSGRLVEALAAFGRALELDPGLSEARLQRATTLMDLGRFAEAVPDLERYVAGHPDDERARFLLRTARERQ